MPACPFCAEKIAAAVAVCPHCGSDVGRKPPRAGTPGAGQGPRGGVKEGGGSGASVVLIVLGVCGVAVLLCGGILVALLLPAVQQARSAARNAQSMNNLRQIGLAFHNFHEVEGAFPPGGTADDSGRSLHGWGMALLPYLEMGFVYGSIDESQPWDSPANDTAMRTQVPTYRSPSVEGPTTDARGYALNHYAGNQELLPTNTSMSLSDISDGASNTVLAGEAAGDFKAWGDPTNVRDLSQGINTGPHTFGRPGAKECILLLSDGSVRRFSDSTDPAVLKALSTPRGGETLPIGF